MTSDRTYRHPVFWLLLQMALLFATLAATGRLEPDLHKDTKSYYVAVDSASLTEALSHYRTYGYALFLKTLGWLGLGREALPWAQVALYFLAVLGFWRGLSRYSGSRWLAFAAATPLLYAPIFQLVSYIQPDFLAAGLMIACVALLFEIVLDSESGTGRFRWVTWLGLTAVVFVTYQVRPAAVFVILWLPLIGGFLELLKHGGWARRAVTRVGQLSLATLLPFLLFAILRLVVVGHFGLVSFGGYNLAALTSSFVNQPLIKELPKETRPLARRIYRTRTEHGWKPLTLGADSREWFDQYNDNLWRISLTIAWGQLRNEKRAGQTPDKPDRVLINDRLSKFSRAVIRQRPRLYLQWVRDAFAHGLEQTAAFPWIRWPFLLVLLTTALAWLRGRRPASERETSWSALRGLAAVVGIAVSFYFVHLLQISLVSLPFPRYTVSTILFLPSALCAVLFEMWRRLLRPVPS